MPPPSKLRHGLHNSLDQKAIGMIPANESFGLPLSSGTGLGSPYTSATSTDFGFSGLLSMSAYASNEFTVSEKVELLVNILQQLVPDVPIYLLHWLFVDLQREPPWLDVALPKGRSVHACQSVFEDLRRQYHRQGSQPRPFPATQHVHIAPAPGGLGGRSFSAQDPSYAPPRHIAPRLSLRDTESPNPGVSNGESPEYGRTTLGPPHPTPHVKRGRPTKQQVEEREKRLALEGKVYVPKKRPTKRMRPSLASDASAPKEEESTTPLLDTPSARAPELLEDTSSGRRKRRQTREQSPLAGYGGSEEAERQEVEPEQESNVAHSPSDRLLPSHHRDRGSAGSSFSRQTHRGSEGLDTGIIDPGYMS